jgi:hypothetical protein
MCFSLYSPPLHNRQQVIEIGELRPGLLVLASPIQQVRVSIAAIKLIIWCARNLFMVRFS